jgi:hypothetical protein
MSEPSPYDVDVHTRFEEMDRRGVPQYMRTDVPATLPRKLEPARVPTDDFVDAEPRERVTWTRLEHGRVRCG